MQNKNIDGIQQHTQAKIATTRRTAGVVVNSYTSKRKRDFWDNRKLLPAVVAVALGISFAGGMWAEHGAATSKASEVVPAGVVATMGMVPTSTLENIPAEEFYNLTIDQVEGYLQEVLKTPEAKEADMLA